LGVFLQNKALRHARRRLDRTDGEDVENHHLARAPDLNQALLAVKAADTGLVVVLEETVRASTMDVDIR
jgi:hypothetical protein